MRIVTGEGICIKEFLLSLGADLPSEPDLTLKKPIRAITLHSSLCRDGDLFISLAKDPEADRRNTEEASRLGALTVGRLGRIRISDPKIALLTLSALYKRRLGRLKTTLMITGSVGKTTTKELLKRLCEGSLTVHATEGNLNNDVGMPITVLTAPKDTELLILECGMNHEGELKRLSEYARPDPVIITNVGTAHIGNLGSREAIARAKLEALYGNPASVLIAPTDEKLLATDHEKVTFRVTFDDSPENATELRHGLSDGDLREASEPDRMTVTHEVTFDGLRQPSTRACHLGGDIRQIDQYNDKAHEADYAFAVCERTCGSRLSVRYGENYHVFDLPLGISHIAESFAAATCAALHLGITPEELCERFSGLGGDVLRYTVTSRGGVTIIDDSYNASLETVKSALGLLMRTEGKRHLALLGEVNELGEFAEKIHTEIGRAAASVGVDELFLCGLHKEQLARGAMSINSDLEIELMPHGVCRDEMADILSRALREGDVLLVKASHSERLGEVAGKLKERLDGV
ncbi:MAG: UDP-N-acetylmuramoyl-tripeptide--D-alanyl-D-alanine ligase [Clostridia bacterium]|nr:UDP-N-acetylmuramoyl-tripeptide--D-alanyl-D-alanine ligase [Clostridia bacterium]